MRRSLYPASILFVGIRRFLVCAMPFLKHPDKLWYIAQICGLEGRPRTGKVDFVRRIAVQKTKGEKKASQIALLRAFCCE